MDKLAKIGKRDERAEMAIMAKMATLAKMAVHLMLLLSVQSAFMWNKYTHYKYHINVLWLSYLWYNVLQILHGNYSE